MSSTCKCCLDLKLRKDVVTKDRNASSCLIDRRSFIQMASMLAAGSALGLYPMGCGVETPIPCLGPAAPPVPVPGMTYIRASQIGCALDCNLENGRNKHTGGAATDDGPIINAAMAGATASNPITLIIDGSALVSGLFLPAGGYWSIAGLGCGTGFFIKKGANNDCIHNGPPNAAIPFDPGPPVPARGKNVSLSNFTVNGNRGDGSSGDSTTGTPQGITNKVWYCGINLMNLDNITIEKIVVVNTPAYNMRLSNVGNVSVSGCVLQGFHVNNDGLHFDGPANDITISNCDFKTADDSIALNAPEGYSGNISRVTVTGCTFNSLSLMRLYTTGGGPKFAIDTVNVSNCSGTASAAAFLFGLTFLSNPASVASLSVSDCTVTAPCVLGVSENFGSIALRNITFIPWASSNIWNQDVPNHVCAFFRPPPIYAGVTCIGSNLSFENCTIQRNSDISAAAVILEYNSTIDNLTFNGFDMQDAGSYSAVPELLNIGSGSIDQLSLNSTNSSNVKICTSPSGFSSIGSVAGGGVLATGWEFPDIVMANNVPYISANSGLPSIKINGVVESYPQS